MIETLLIRIDPRRIKLLDLNARLMRHEQYKRLVDNVKRDGRLTSTPLLAVKDWHDDSVPMPEGPDGEPVYEVLSGNHRVMAAVDAGLTEIDCMAIQGPLAKDKRIAIQLSHNAIAGEDDPAILKKLFEEIGNVDERLYAGLDDQTLQLLDKVNLESLSEANLKFHIVTLMFLPEEAVEIKATLEEALRLVKADEAWAAGLRQYEPFMTALDEAGKAHNISNLVASLRAVLAVYGAHKADLGAVWDERAGESPAGGQWVPMSTIFGLDVMPVAVARNVRRAVQKMVDAGDITQDALWRAIELWAADALAGPN